LQNNWHRWYCSDAGWWLSQDPLGFAAGDTNVGRYVGNWPVNATDPSGEADKIPPGTPANGYKGLGSWEFKTEDEIIAFLAKLFGRQLTEEEIDKAKMGCIGLVFVRIGQQNGTYPLSPLSYSGASFYFDSAAALKEFNSLQDAKNGPAWLMIAVQVPIKRGRTQAVKKLVSDTGTQKFNIQDLNNLIDWDRATADYNWSSWHPWGDSGYWEWMNINWKEIDPENLPRIEHRQNLPRMGGSLTFYMVVQGRK
jgi:hypothetical protein